MGMKKIEGWDVEVGDTLKRVSRFKDGSTIVVTGIVHTIGSNLIMTEEATVLAAKDAKLITGFGEFDLYLMDRPREEEVRILEGELYTNAGGSLTYVVYSGIVYFLTAGEFKKSILTIDKFRKGIADGILKLKER